MTLLVFFWASISESTSWLSKVAMVEKAWVGTGHGDVVHVDAGSRLQTNQTVVAKVSWGWVFELIWVWAGLIEDSDSPPRNPPWYPMMPASRLPRWCVANLKRSTTIRRWGSVEFDWAGRICWEFKKDADRSHFHCHLKGSWKPSKDGKMQRKERRRRVIIWENIANP